MPEEEYAKRTDSVRYVPSSVQLSVVTVLIFQFSPGFCTEASVPAIPRYQFGSISVPNQVDPKLTGT